MGLHLITSMRVVPAAVRAPAPADPLLGLPLPAQFARAEASPRAPPATHASPDFRLRLRLRLPQSAGHTRTHSEQQARTHPASPPDPSATLDAEDRAALDAIRARVPLAERHIQRLVDAVRDWVFEHPGVPPPANIGHQVLHQLHAHLPADDGAHYVLRLSIHTPDASYTCFSPARHTHERMSPPATASYTTNTNPCDLSPHIQSQPPPTPEPTHAHYEEPPWTMTARVTPAPAASALPPRVRLDPQPSRKFPNHPEPTDAQAAFGVVHKTSHRERYSEAQLRVKANLKSVCIPKPENAATVGLAEKSPASASDEKTVFSRPYTSPNDLHPASSSSSSSSSSSPEAELSPVFDVLLWSRDAIGQTRFLESGIANLIFEDIGENDRDDRFITPIVRTRDGPLPGMMRNELLACGLISEGDINVDDVLQRPDNWRIYLCNAVRGVFEVQLVK